MGIWLAFLYPNALQKLVNPSKVENVDFSVALAETKRLESIVASVLRSAFVVMMIMLIFMLKIIISNFEFYSEYILFIKSFTLSFSLLLGLLQFESILYVIYSNVMFINDLHAKRQQREEDSDL